MKSKYFLAILSVVLLTTTTAEARHRHHHRHHHRLPWCGFYMQKYTGIHKSGLGLARNWAREGVNAHGPHVGAIVVWPHHVGKIVGRDDRSGQWIVHSGNDGNAVRTRPRSVTGAIAFRYVGRQMAGFDSNFDWN